MKIQSSVRWKPLIISILIPLAVGGLSAFLTMDSMETYQAIYHPPLSPPSFLFPIVWSILFILMGIGSYLVYQSSSDSAEKKRALWLYGIQLAINFIWPLLFFNLQSYWVAFFWLLLLILFVALTFVAFYQVSHHAAWLLIPYLAWLVFAGYLNFGVAFLN